MTARRLSGWARLWIVFAILVWTFGVFSISVILATAGPIDADLLIAVAVPAIFYALLPVVVAALFVAGKWVFRGFRPQSK
jgi:hypothetical protein